MGITILTYCSRAYLPAFRWVLPSWQRDEIDKIIVVSDFVPDAVDAVRAVWHPDYHPSEDWFTNSSRRPEIVRKYAPDGMVAFFDLDCWIRRPILPAFGSPDNISVTRFWSTEAHTGGTITSGTIYMNVGSGVRRFLENWQSLTKKKGRWHSAPGRATTQQYTFTALCREAFKTGSPCHINTIPEQVYNCEHSVRDQLAIKARVNNPAVIHFKEKAWRDREFVRRIIACAEGKT